MATEPDGSEDALHRAGPTPNREARREPAIIDAKAEEVVSEPQAQADDAAAVDDLAADDEPRGERVQPLRAAPDVLLRRMLPWFALALAGVAFLIAGGVGYHLFVTTDGAIVDLRRATADLQARSAGLDQKAAGTTALESRMAALETAMKTATANLASLRSQADAAASVAQSPAAAPAVPAAPAAVQVDLSPIEQRLAALEARLQPLAAAVAQSSAAVAQSKVDVNADQESLRKAVSSSDAAALVVVAQSLLGALDRGAPFTSEAAAAVTLGANPDRIAVLQPVAAKGVPTAAALADSFAPLAAPILTGSQSKEPQGFLDRLERGASNLVRVRPVGDVTGDDPAAIVARIEGALGRGDVAAAVAAWQQLPAAAKNVTGDWASAARARVAADIAAQGLLADAIDRLGRSKS